MGIGIGFILVLLALGYVAYPLFRGRVAMVAEEPAMDKDLENLLARRDATYAAIKELEFDRQAGGLSEDDYRDLLERYKRKAVALLREIDQAQGAKRGAMAEQIEQEVTALRRRKRQLRAKESGVARGQACPRCGAPSDPQDDFCSVCGASLVLRCPQCGTMYEPTDRYCSKCGAKLG
ncbi:MAG: zinc ribbon domain-containing protein [Chloroflexi bacterium]|nr:zinc ribbon domain-containing protein [Chloroflexota bacterium]MCL5075311.1 zinc ribbon domain-containing protein [Chloroflexota bacterium]